MQGVATAQNGSVLPWLGPVVVPRLRAPLLATPANPFHRGRDERPLRLIVDTAAMQRSPELDALLNVCRRPDVKAATTTSEAGLWTVQPPVVRPDGHLIGEIDHHDGAIDGPIVRDATTWTTLARNLHGEIGGDLTELERRALIVAIGRDKHDLLVADDPRTYLPGGPTVVDASTGIALVGLFLRSRGIGTFSYDNTGQHLKSPGEQRVIARKGLLDAAHERWWLGCIAGDRDLPLIGQALVIRFQRAMRARDEVMVACLAPKEQAPWDAICYHLDALLVWLTGAFDVAAHIARSVFDMSKVTTVGWRSRQWRKKLHRAAPSLWELTEKGSPVRAVVDLIAELRNTIHGQAISEFTFVERGSETTLLELPTRAYEEVVKASDVVFGRTAWGCKGPPMAEAEFGGMWDPYVLVQMLMPFAAEALKVIMSSTEVERLPGVTEAALDPGPRHEVYDEPILGRIMRLNGYRWSDGALSLGQEHSSSRTPRDPTGT
jgi:hypothetical protein